MEEDDAAARKKRKRSAIACIACHQRKVRCNAAWQGIPCSNCVEDGVSCNIYRRGSDVPKRKTPYTAESTQGIETPPQSVTTSALCSANGSQVSPIAPSEDTLRLSPQSSLGKRERRGSASTKGRSTPERRPVSQSTFRAAAGRPRHAVRPFYAGESEGLEFLFDICCPERPIKGQHYAVPAYSYRAQRIQRKSSSPSAQQMPALIVQQELLRCFFEHVWPLLPVVDLRDFLTNYTQDPAAFVDREVLKAHSLPSRKSLKEQCYQNAKDIFDAQEEPDKTVLIQSALLLASAWYIDLEDRDGMTHWLGVAISLAYTIGLHRADNYDTVSPRPFSDTLRRTWKCLWWNIMYRETWTAFGFGRPMRVDSEDCDLAMPTVDDVLGDASDALPADCQDLLPSNAAQLPKLWINLLELSQQLEHILKSYYRPRSNPPAPAQLQHDESSILSSRDRLQHYEAQDHSYSNINMLHLKAYYSAVLISLYRPCMARQLKQPNSYTTEFQHDIVARAKRAAGKITRVLSELISSNAVDKASSMLVTANLNAMQIYMWEIRHSIGIARQYASNQMDLHMMVVSHLRRTYWTADLQNNLFTEALKILENGPVASDKFAAGSSQHQELEQTVNAANGDASEVDQAEPWMQGTLEDFLHSFNPFMGLPLPGEDMSGSVDWELGPASPLMVDGMHQRLS